MKRYFSQPEVGNLEELTAHDGAPYRPQYLVFDYPTKRTLFDVNVTVSRGSVTVLVGANGNSHGDDVTTGLAKLTEKLSPLISELEVYIKESTAE